MIEVHKESLKLARANINSIVLGGEVIAVVNISANLDISVNGDPVESGVPRKFLYALSIFHLCGRVHFSLDDIGALWGSAIDVKAFNNHANAVKSKFRLSKFWRSSRGYRKIYGLSWNIQATEEDIRAKMSSMLV